MFARWIATALVASALSPFGGAAHRLTERGNDFYRAEDLDEALRAYTQAQVHAPEAPELYYDIGNVLYEQGDFAAAEEAYRRALGRAEAGLFDNAAFNLGNALYRQEKFDEAAREYRRVLARTPSDEDAKRNLELALRRLQQSPQQQQQQQTQQPQQPEQNDDQGTSQPQPSDDSSPDDAGEQPSPDESSAPEGSAGAQSGGPEGSPESGDRPQPQPGEGKMTPEEAAKLLDALAEEEKESLREQLRRQRARAQRTTEEDW